MCSCDHTAPERSECPGDCGCWDLWSVPSNLPEGYWRVKKHPQLMINRDGYVRVAKTGNLLLAFKKDPKDHDREKMIRFKQNEQIFEYKIDELVRDNIPPF